MFSRSKPEWEGLSGREKKTVRDNKKQLSPFAQHDNVSQGNVTWSRRKQQRVSLIELLSSWFARGACELHVTCTLVLEVLSLLSSIIIFCSVYFRAPFSFFWSVLFLSSQVCFMKEQGKPLEPGYMLQPQSSLNYGFTLLSNPQPSILDLKSSIVMQILKAWERLKW